MGIKVGSATINGVKVTKQGNSKWQRPAEWPNYDLLNLTTTKEESVYFTYDNRIKGAYVSLNIGQTPWVVQRVQINSDGTVTVLDEHSVSDQGYGEFIPEDAGDWVCYRALPGTNKHITAVGFNGGNNLSYLNQLCVERYGYVPYLNTFGPEYSYRSAHSRNIISDTFFGDGSYIANYSAQEMRSLQNLDGDYVRYSSLYLSGISEDGIHIPLSPTLTSFQNFASGANKLTVLDLSGTTLTGKPTTIQNMLLDNNYIQVFKFPKGDWSEVATVGTAFKNAISLQVIDFPDSFVCTLAANCTQNCHACRAIILRADQVVGIADTSAIYTEILKKGGARIYVPEDLIDDYKEATNWVTLYTSYPDMFGAIEGSIYEEG